MLKLDEAPRCLHDTLNSLSDSAIQVSALRRDMHGGTVCKDHALIASLALAEYLLFVVVLTLKGYHVPAVRHRDTFYQKIEDERASALGHK